MRRYYVCKVVDYTMPSGQVVRLPKIDTYRHADGTSAAYVTHPAGGWVLAVLSHPTAVPTFAADPDIKVLPDVALDVEWNAIDRAARNAAVKALTDFGAAAPAVEPGEGYRHLIRRVGVQADGNFHEDRFGVPG